LCSTGGKTPKLGERKRRSRAAAWTNEGNGMDLGVKRKSLRFFSSKSEKANRLTKQSRQEKNEKAGVGEWLRQGGKGDYKKRWLPERGRYQLFSIAT